MAKLARASRTSVERKTPVDVKAAKIGREISTIEKQIKEVEPSLDPFSLKVLKAKLKAIRTIKRTGRIQLIGRARTARYYSSYDDKVSELKLDVMRIKKLDEREKHSRIMIEIP